MQGVAVPHPQLNIRLDPRTEAVLKLLRDHLNLSAAAVIRLALIRLARAEGLEVPRVED